MRRVVLVALTIAVGSLLAESPRVRAAWRAFANTSTGHIRPDPQSADRRVAS